MKAGYKESELGEIPNDWKVDSIETLIQKKFIVSHLDGNHGELYPKASEFTDNGIPYVAANNFLNGKVDFKSCKKLSKERAAKFKKGVAKNGDILFAHNATVGPVALLQTDLEYVILSTTATYFRCNNELLNNLFLKYFLESSLFKNQYLRVMGQTTRNQVPITMQRTFLSLLPPLPEQQKIAEILTTVDDKLENIDLQITEYQQLKKGLMQQLLTKGIGHTEFVDSVLGMIPKVWKVVKLEDLAERISDGIHTTPKYVESSDYYFINGNNLDNGKIKITESTKCVDIDEYNKHRRDLNGNTILMSINGTIGNIAFFNGETVILGKSAAYININSKTDKAFTFYLLQSNYVIKFYENELTGTTIRNLSLKSIKNTPIALPPLPEQIQIAKILTSVDDKLELLHNQKDEYTSLKKGLMEQLLTGKVRVKV